MAAHELRHPATIFKGYSFLLLERRDTLSPEAFDDAIRSIDEAATRVTRLVNDLFDASRIERGKMGIKREEVQPGKLLLRAVEEMRVKGCERDFVLSSHDEVTELRADGERIKQVLWILLDNDEREPHKGRVRAPACLHGRGEGRHQEEARRAGDMRLSKQVITEYERARTMIANDIHDGVGQSLVTLKMEFDTFRKSASGDLGEDGREKLDRMDSTLREIIKEIRRLASELRPPLLDDFGFERALEVYVGEFSLSTGILTSFSSNGTTLRWKKRRKSFFSE